MTILKYRLFIIASIFVLTGCSTQNAALICTREFGENDRHVYKYSFENGKAYLLDLSLTAPITSIADVAAFEKEYLKINDVSGCTARVATNTDGSHTSQHVCNFKEMTDEDIQKVYSAAREDLQSSRKEIVKHFEYDEGMKCE